MHQHIKLPSAGGSIGVCMLFMPRCSSMKGASCLVSLPASANEAILADHLAAQRRRRAERQHSDGGPAGGRH